MKRLFLAGLLAVAGLAGLPAAATAADNHPYSAHGFGWFHAKVFNQMPWIHSNGPLYNYGPYIPGPGYTTMHIPEPYHGSYVPANYGLYGPGAGYPYQQGQGAPAAGQQQQPQLQQQSQQPQSQQMPQAMPQSQAIPMSSAPSRFRLFDRSRVVPASASVYPGWLTGR